jgi:tetratricopeptide (TPR) repeat protein
MASFSWRQWSAIIIGALLFTSLFFINRKLPKTDSGQQQGNGHAAQVISIDSIFSEAEAQVPEALKGKVDKIKNALTTDANEVQVRLIESIIDIYDSAGAQIPATYYTEKLATIEKSSSLWYNAGDRYYKCAEVVTNNARVPLLQRAMQCFDNSVKADSNNLSAIVGKGECIVQGGGNPMDGIKMINEVLKKDSNNEKAHIALGIFSIQSGQFPKAIYRFKKVLKLDPTYTEAYVYLAQASESSGDKASAISYLKKYSTFVRDSAIKMQVNNYIKKLENNTVEQQNNGK